MILGLCGGTFDPFHRGHLDPVLAVRELFRWDTVLYIPAFRQPFKTEQQTSSGYHRFAMAALATAHVDRTSVSPIELEREEISYTVDTLRSLRAANPGATLDWIIGDDNLASLGAWRDLDTIFTLANFAVLTRGGGVLPAALLDAHGNARVPVLRNPAQRTTQGAVVFAPNPTVPISATEIRARVRAGQPIEEFVDPLVASYIHHNRLYREDPR